MSLIIYSHFFSLKLISVFSCICSLVISCIFCLTLFYYCPIISTVFTKFQHDARWVPEEVKELIPKEMTASKFMHQDDKLLQVSNCQWVGKNASVHPRWWRPCLWRLSRSTAVWVQCRCSLITSTWTDLQQEATTSTAAWLHAHTWRLGISIKGS